MRLSALLAPITALLAASPAVAQVPYAPANATSWADYLATPAVVVILIAVTLLAREMWLHSERIKRPEKALFLDLLRAPGDVLTFQANIIADGSKWSVFGPAVFGWSVAALIGQFINFGPGLVGWFPVLFIGPLMIVMGVTLYMTKTMYRARLFRVVGDEVEIWQSIEMTTPDALPAKTIMARVSSLPLQEMLIEVRRPSWLNKPVEAYSVFTMHRGRVVNFIEGRMSSDYAGAIRFDIQEMIAGKRPAAPASPATPAAPIGDGFDL